jgi:hypothetical protein
MPRQFEVGVPQLFQADAALGCKLLQVPADSLTT